MNRAWMRLCVGERAVVIVSAMWTLTFAVWPVMPT